jgi:hypothetical protein
MRFDTTIASRAVNLLLLLAGVAVACTGQEDSPCADTEVKQLNVEWIEVLRTSDDPGEIRDAAVALAQSEDPQDLHGVAGYLISGPFLDRLDSEADYDGPSRQLRLARVLKALADNPSPAARRSLILLTQSTDFVSNPVRVDVLIDIWAEVSDPPAEAVRFWDYFSQPDDGFVHRTINRLAYNGSPAAILLLEKKITEPTHSIEDRAYWARRYLIELRNDPFALEICQRMLSGPLEPEVAVAIVDSLFDYEPRWYGSHDEPIVPERALASDVAIAKLVEIARYALANFELDERLKGKVEDTLESIKPRK